MKLLDIKKKNPQELEKLLAQNKKELFNLNSASLAGENSNKKKARISSVKRDIARIKTILNQNE